jgi:Na+/H+ antiporter NhaA
MDNIEIIGLGTNLSCLYGVLPNNDKLIQLCLYKQLVETKFNVNIPFISGGSSVTIPLVIQGLIPKGINHFRVGETLFMGTDVYNNSKFENMENNIFKLYAEIIELYEKPLVPSGEMGTNLEGENITFKEELYGKTTVRAIIDIGLMAIFFLLVGLEIKREIVEGELSSLRQASLPVLAAIGGVAVPALIYTFFNNSSPDTIHGWGIPMATDIAFALGILSLLGDKVPTGLKIFLAALAIVDDLMAILVIAIFYSSELHLTYLMYAAAVFALLLIFNRIGITNIFFYIIPGIVMWYLIHHSGVHATIAGVLTALTLPTTDDDKESALEKLEHALTKPVNFIIMPIFAIANTNITFESGMAEGLASNLGLGIVLGLFLGKPVGIFLMSYLSVKTKNSRTACRHKLDSCIRVRIAGRHRLYHVNIYSHTFL